MARTPLNTVQPDNGVTEKQAKNVGEMVDAVRELTAYDAEINDNARMVAHQIGYDGALTVGTLEDEIRFYQRRSVEACIELGKRLLVLKELTPHGEFESRVELLGFATRTARRFMQAAVKVSKSANLAVLSGKVETASKFLELLILDDDEVQALDSGETVRGVTLDKIDTMSISELKKALRETKETIDAKDKVIEIKEKALSRKDEQLAVLENKAMMATPDEQALALRTDYEKLVTSIKATVISSLRAAIIKLDDIAEGDHTQFVAAGLIEIGRELNILRADFDLPDTLTEAPMLDPTWTAVMAEMNAQQDSE